MPSCYSSCKDKCKCQSHCLGCSKQICASWDTLVHKCTDDIYEIPDYSQEIQCDHYINYLKHSTNHKLVDTIPLSFFTPVINFLNEKTYLWRRGISPSNIIIPYSQIHSFSLQDRLISEIEEYQLSIILQLPSEINNPLPIISPTELESLASIPFAGVMAGFNIDFRNLPKRVTWKAIDRNLSQAKILLEFFDLPVIATLPGAYTDQMQLALKNLASIGIKQIALRGGQYTLIKLHSRLNSYLDLIHQSGLVPLLYWDVWWVPSRLLHVNHFFGPSWWQFGLTRLSFVRKKHYMCHYSHSDYLKTEDIITHNYNFFVNHIRKRNREPIIRSK